MIEDGWSTPLPVKRKGLGRRGRPRKDEEGKFIPIRDRKDKPYWRVPPELKKKTGPKKDQPWYQSTAMAKAEKEFGPLTKIDVHEWTFSTPWGDYEPRVYMAACADRASYIIVRALQHLGIPFEEARDLVRGQHGGKSGIMRKVRKIQRAMADQNPTNIAAELRKQARLAARAGK